MFTSRDREGYLDVTERNQLSYVTFPIVLSKFGPEVFQKVQSREPGVGFRVHMFSLGLMTSSKFSDPLLYSTVERTQTGSGRSGVGWTLDWCLCTPSGPFFSSRWVDSGQV